MAVAVEEPHTYGLRMVRLTAFRDTPLLPALPADTVIGSEAAAAAVPTDTIIDIDIETEGEESQKKPETMTEVREGPHAHPQPQPQTPAQSESASSVPLHQDGPLAAALASLRGCLHQCR